MVFQRERRVVASIAHCTIIGRRMFGCHVLWEREKDSEIRTERRIDKNEDNHCFKGGLADEPSITE